ncbi:MAG: DUF6502 family protein [Steroidobacteraceae bacterium]|jgi:hypothetical protein
MVDVLRPRVLEALSKALEPVVLLLLKSGISWKDFSDLAKEKFVTVATDAFGIRGRPTNLVRVAILSGLDRREVARLRRRASDRRTPPQGYMSKPTQVLHAWYHDPQYLDPSGKPRELEIEGTDGSFAELVRRYAPGIPLAAMIKELRAAGSIADAPGNRLRALKRSYVPRELNENMVRLWGSVLQDVGTTLQHNLYHDAGAEPRFERRALSLRVDPESVPEFREMLQREGQAFLERIDEWITAHEVDASDDPGSGVRLGVGIYQIQEPAASSKKTKARAATHSGEPR